MMQLYTKYSRLIIMIAFAFLFGLGIDVKCAAIAVGAAIAMIVCFVRAIVLWLKENDLEL